MRRKRLYLSFQFEPPVFDRFVFLFHLPELPIIMDRILEYGLYRIK